MKFFETSKQYSLKKSIYINLRWIGIIGQLISIYLVYFCCDFLFNFIISNIFIALGVISNFYLIFIYKKTQLTDRSAFIHLLIDIIQLSGLIYLTGGIKNPFIIFLIIPSVFASSNLGFRTNSVLVLITTLSILFLSFFSKGLPGQLGEHFHVSSYYFNRSQTSPNGSFSQVYEMKWVATLVDLRGFREELAHPTVFLSCV